VQERTGLKFSLKHEETDQIQILLSMEFARLVIVRVIVPYMWVSQWVCSTIFPCCCEVVFDLRLPKFKSIFLMKLLSLWLFYVSVCTYMWCFSVALFKQEDGGWTGNSFPLDFNCPSR
jgi:hypothetical protein